MLLKLLNYQLLVDINSIVGVNLTLLIYLSALKNYINIKSIDHDLVKIIR